MFDYYNEASFSKALTNAMKKKGMFVQRIESGTTGRGIPDLFVMTKGFPLWIELKRVHSKVSLIQSIPWRPGQQSWLHRVTTLGCPCITLACFDDCIIKIPHDIIYKDNLINTRNVPKYKSIKELLG